MINNDDVRKFVVYGQLKWTFLEGMSDIIGN